AACSKGTSSKPAPASASASASGASGSGASASPKPAPLPPPPKVSPACQQARQWFGGSAECVETPLPALTTPAGQIVRLMAKGDATADYVYALVPASGDPIVGAAGVNQGFFDDVMKKLDLAKTDPALLAQLYASLGEEAAVVRCLPGTNDTLP